MARRSLELSAGGAAPSFPAAAGSCGSGFVSQYGSTTGWRIRAIRATDSAVWTRAFQVWRSRPP